MRCPAPADYAMLPGMDVAALQRAVPGCEVLTDPGDLAPYAADWSSAAILADQRGALPTPAAVLRPTSPDHVAAALAWASAAGVAVIAAGGRSGVSGGILSRGDELLLDMRGLAAVIDLDEVSGVVRVQAGVLGTVLEDWLNQRGFTLGHSPQSVALSTVGGWIAARSAGQLSSGYGAIEDMLVALTAAFPDGRLGTSRAVPRTAAGPQLHRLLLGSEGTLGVVTEAWLRVRRKPTHRAFAAVGFSTFQEGLDAARRMAQAGTLADAVRVYDQADVQIAFRTLPDPPDMPVGVLVCEGGDDADARLQRVLQSCGGQALGDEIARHWWDHRNDAVDSYRRVLSGEMLGAEAAVDTIEVAALWSRTPALYAGVGAALGATAAMVGCHCSHVYETGCALYYTFLVNSDDREAALGACWSAALDAALEAGGTITHHHGVGQLKTAWLGREMDGFASFLAPIQAVFDPAGIMNPRTLRVSA